MPTVQAGNKQIGDFTAIAVTGALNNSQTITGKLLEGFAVVKDSSNTNAGLPPNNLFLGDVTTVAVTGSKLNAQTITAKLLQGLTVIKYAPPSSMQAKLLQGLAIVQQDAIPQPVKPANLLIGDFELVAVTGAKPNQQSLTCSLLQALAVVKQFEPRNELVTFNIEFE